MKMFKKVVLCAAMALAFSGAQASMINVGGVTWDPDAATDFSSASLNMRQFIDAGTGSLSGFGVINSFNGTSQATFCASCELTFTYGGFNVVGGTLIPGVGQTLSYTGGWININVGASEIANPFDYNSLTAANTGNGNLFLKLQNNGTFLGTNLGFILSGLGYLDVVGGMAASNFDTNTQVGGTDIAIATALTYTHNTITGITDMSGGGNFYGNSIPEPSSIALLGLGLLGAGVLRRRKADK